jgi:hypothetical protein
MGHASTQAALIYLHARKQRGQVIAAGIDAMVGKATKKAEDEGHDQREGHVRATRRSGVQKWRPLEMVGRSVSRGRRVERVTGIEPA